MAITHYVNLANVSVSVKEAAFFEEQGGLTDDWGQTWIGVTADSIDLARQLGEIMVEGKHFDRSVADRAANRMATYPMHIGGFPVSLRDIQTARNLPDGTVTCDPSLFVVEPACILNTPAGSLALDKDGVPVIPDYTGIEWPAEWGDEKIHPEQVDVLARIVYLQNVERGWWDEPDRSTYRTLMLVITEIAEATEGDRKDLQDTHLPHRKMVEVGIADTLIRLLDLAGRFEWKFQPLGAPPHFLMFVAKTLPDKHLALSAAVCNIAVEVFNQDERFAARAYSSALTTLFTIAGEEGYELGRTVFEKLQFNKTRADHSREARTHFDGKRY